MIKVKEYENEQMNVEPQREINNNIFSFFAIEAIFDIIEILTENI